MTQQIRAFMVHKSLLTGGGYSIHRVDFKGKRLRWVGFGLHRREHSMTEHADPCFNGAHAQHPFMVFTEIPKLQKP